MTLQCDKCGKFFNLKITHYNRKILVFQWKKKNPKKPPKNPEKPQKKNPIHKNKLF